jgi:hypothetical protein
MNMAHAITYIYEFRSKDLGTATATKALQKVLTQKIAKIILKKNAFGLALSAFFFVHYIENNVRWTYNKEGNKK